MRLKLLSKFVCIISVVFLFAGCASLPVYDSCLGMGMDQQVALSQLRGQWMPVDFRIVNSINFEYMTKSISSIGYAQINRHDKSFTVVATNPMGVTLFELKFKDGKLEHEYVLSELSEMGDLAKAVSVDIQSIFFEPVNSENTQVCMLAGAKLYKSHSADLFYHEFFDEEDRLVKKEAYKNKRLFWSVSYDDYKDFSSAVFPRKIVLEHKQYRYKLTLNIKELTR